MEADRPPVRLLIGGDALHQWRAQLDNGRQDADAWEQLIRSADFVKLDGDS